MVYLEYKNILENKIARQTDLSNVVLKFLNVT